MNITRSTMIKAVDYVEGAARVAEIHTVMLTSNGRHGGVDLCIEGDDRDLEGNPYIRVFELS